jgi:hypothetical protein
MNKLFYKISSGVFGGIILGMTAFIFLINYSEKHGECYAFANFLFSLVGVEYEACGNLSVSSGMPMNIILSIVLGGFLGIFLIGRIKIIHYLRYSIALILATFFLPLLYFNLKSFPVFLRISDVFSVSSIVFIFILFSVMPSTIVVLTGNWLKNKFRK